MRHLEHTMDQKLIHVHCLQLFNDIIHIKLCLNLVLFVCHPLHKFQSPQLITYSAWPHTGFFVRWLAGTQSNNICLGSELCRKSADEWGIGTEEKMSDESE